jgi:GH15 family glucan-1,4-alpha-glucosidase
MAATYPPERDLRGWAGYAQSLPVRVGNGAAEQHQLDGYGWVLDAAWVLVQAGHHLYSETWRAMRGFADLVARRWREPDAASGRSATTPPTTCTPS